MKPSAEPREIIVALAGAALGGELAVPPGARGLVLFVHGSGGGRFSPRNLQVARHFNALGLGTLLFDLLTVDEQRVDEITREFRFDIPLLARRTVAVLDWLDTQNALRSLRIGLFGASTGAAAALIGAAERPDVVATVVSRGGRTDLADAIAARVRAPALFIVGGWDEGALDFNRASLALLRSERRLEIVPGATHLFEEPGRLEIVATLAGGWFARHLI